MTAKLELVEASATKLGEETFLLRLVVENSGYLSTAGSDKATENKVSREIVAEIGLPASAELLRGKSREEIGQGLHQGGHDGISGISRHRFRCHGRQGQQGPCRVAGKGGTGHRDRAQRPTGALRDSEGQCHTLM